MEWSWLIIAAAVALAAVVVAHVVDRANARRRRQILESPPDRAGLDLPDGHPAPAYLTEEAVRAGARADRADRSRAADPGGAGTEDERLTGVVPVEAGWTSPDFAQGQDRVWLTTPVVLVAEAVTRVEELWDLISLTKASRSALVVAGARIEAEVSQTLALNALSGRLRCLCVRTDRLDEVARRSGATVVSAADLSAGYVPAASLGRCQLWVADDRHSWIVSDGGADEAGKDQTAAG